MTFSDARPYEAQRRALMLLLCPSLRCHHCGRRCRSHRSMEFDHLGLRPWVVRRLNRYHRLRVMLREWRAAGAVVGQGVVGACIPCNKRGGAARAHAKVYDGTPEAAARAARGAGYTAQGSISSKCIGST